MEDFYRFHPAAAAAIFCSDHNNNNNVIINNDDHHLLAEPMMMMRSINDDDIFDILKTQIIRHPRYPSLVHAYLQCRKVGASTEIASLLDEVYILLEDQTSHIHGFTYDHNPELDQFMELYCKVLERYKDELSKPVEEATTFLTQIETQLSKLLLVNDNTTTPTSYSFNYLSGSSSAEELQSCYSLVEASESSCDKQKSDDVSTQWMSSLYGPRRDKVVLKDMLLHKFGGYLVSDLTRKELSKKRKKAKLPMDSRTTLLEWWKTHSRWPYPTEEEKMKLIEETGLAHKQITNWFINRRKRYWKPSI